MTTHSTSVSVLWFKRDLRLRDHAPLQAAIAAGRPVVLLYCFEPSVMADPNYDLRHWRFVQESLADLNRQLTRLAEQKPNDNQPVEHEWLPFVFDNAGLDGEAERRQPGQVWVFYREVIDMLTELAQQYHIDTIFSHEETGLKVTYDRDKAVAKWCQTQSVAWQEFQSNGVIRRLKDREGWPALWQKTMRAEQQHPAIDRLNAVALDENGWFAAHRGPDLPAELGQPDSRFQPGGEANAHRYLQSWVTERIALYGASISKPLESRKGCSRLSPYIAWGCLSIRQVFQAQLAAKETVGFKGQFAAFASRLRWHCHFIQKFETEDRMEFENVNRGFDSIEKNNDPAAYQAWATGHTGFPMVDACMRCLQATGYINFRMRAMLMSFLTHHLFQHWKEGAVHLSRIFTDFEPGIHYAQTQMQAGMTGTNTVRVYNPVKQSHDHDPLGVFVKMWVPELENVPVAYIHEPWTMPPLEQEMYDFHVGHDYPLPIVDLAVTAREAQKKLYAQRKNEVAKGEKDRILKKHAIPRTFADKKKPKEKLVAETPTSDEPEEAVGVE
ncbi:FAD-binding domain-containing protein [Fibrella aquatilis]|uniref:Deoxyribodipyrimidine photo-lyase n=1 Tax=Fibrella aquatilis TaxID=2817059 RepID=A0A939K0U6_9BACT|nr:deoxyribodipyrimidine photo-lyase [Fibrella aquatilis]MBO0932828.1 deoxyribodipyrimidine photo-lyase [Fibrella aquatilis]